MSAMQMSVCADLFLFNQPLKMPAIAPVHHVTDQSTTSLKLLTSEKMIKIKQNVHVVYDV